jgi:hypothetical protein
MPSASLLISRLKMIVVHLRIQTGHLEGVGQSGSAGSIRRSIRGAPVVPVTEAVRVELEGIAFRDGLKAPVKFTIVR